MTFEEYNRVAIDELRKEFMKYNKLFDRLISSQDPFAQENEDDCSL